MKNVYVCVCFVFVLVVVSRRNRGKDSAHTVVSKLITDRHFLWGELISNYSYRIVLPEESIPVTETDPWKCRQKVSHYRYRFCFEF